MMLANGSNNPPSPSNGNRTRITNSPNSSFQVTHSDVFLQNSPNSQLTGDHNQVYLINCANAVIGGSNNRVRGTNMPNGKVNGEHNTIAANRIYNLQLAGSQNICELADEANPRISGNENRVLASGNANLLVSGNGNCVGADKTGNLQIKSNCSSSKIVVSHSRNIAVEGKNNQISVRNTKISHCLRRNGGVGRDGSTFVTFTGNRFQVNNASAPAQPSQPLQNPPEVDPNARMWSCEEETYVPVEPSIGNCTFSTGFTPHLKISYDEKLSINNMDYVIGIFHFKLELLRKNSGPEYVSLLGIRVDLDQLDGDLCAFKAMVNGEDHLYLSGESGGISESLGLTAPRIMICRNRNEFIIDLNPDWVADQANAESEDDVDEDSDDEVDDTEDDDTEDDATEDDDTEDDDD